MKPLELPLELSGSWEHALILTYGADIAFFERAIRPQLAKSCRNVVILADGQHYLDTYVTYSDGSLLRHLNQRYVFDGIFVPHAAHAKLILLVNSDRGRLLVGSGNLSLQGYASGGELFTQYDFNPTSTEQLPAFLTVRDFLNELLAHDYLGPIGARHLQLLLNDTPWLFRATTDVWRPLRHNLHASFLRQIQDSTQSDLVQELWILSPFLDEEAIALEQLLKDLRPQKATLLVQPEWVSADPAALKKIQIRYRQLQIRPFSLKDNQAYVHAKLYLLKMARRSVCLQGSPNLSQVAMLLTGTSGNLELANLVEGQRTEFDDLLQALDIGSPYENLEDAGLSYKKPAAPAVPPISDWRLTGGEWQGNMLTIYFQGQCPDLKISRLLIDDQPFELQLRRQQPHSLEIALSELVQEILIDPVPLSISWNTNHCTNPIFVCNRAALDKQLQSPITASTLSRVGTLEIDDEDLEQLLADLESALVITERSIWQITGSGLDKIPPSGDSEPLPIDYSQLDYEAIRRHPRVQQYLQRGSGGTRTVQTRLAIILKSITDHFNVLPEDFVPSRPPVEVIEQPPTSEDTDESATEQTDVADERRQRQMQRRVKRALKRFVKRYLDGFGKTAFQQLLGFEVVVQNYAIFNHILWRLLSKEWLEVDFIAEGLIQLWNRFWGDETHRGYWGTLSAEEQSRARELLLEYQADASVLAALYWCYSELAFERVYIRADEEENGEEAGSHDYGDDEDDHVPDLEYAASDANHPQIFQLREIWHRLLINPPFDITAATLEKTWYSVAKMVVHEPPRPSQIAGQLMRLARFDTSEHFLQSISVRYGLPSDSCVFERMGVYREVLGRTVEAKGLIISSAKPLANFESAQALLLDWMRFERLDYYRINYPSASQTNRVILYDVDDYSGVYFCKDTDEIAFGPIVPVPTEWENGLIKLQMLAAEVDNRAVWPQAVAAKSS